MKNTRRILSLALSLIMLLSLCACGKAEKTQEENKPRAGEISEEGTVTPSYTVGSIPKPQGIRRIKGLSIAGDRRYVLGSSGDEDCIFTAGAGEEQWKKLSLVPDAGKDKGETGDGKHQPFPMEINAFGAGDEKIIIVGTRYKEGGQTCYIFSFDPESAELQEVHEAEGLEGQYVESWTILGDYLIASAAGASFVFSAEKPKSLYSLDERLLFAADVKGEFYAAAEGEGEGRLCRFNIETGELEEICSFPSQEYMSYSSYMSEKGLYISDEKSLYSVDPDSGEIKELLKWNDIGAGIVSAPECLHIMENGEMYMADTWSNIMYKAGPYDGKPKKVLTIAYTIAGGVYESAARAKFNMENEDYIIREMRFDMEHPETLITQITAGDMPDILYMGNSTDRAMDNPFVNVEVDESLCVDLMPYLEKEPELMEGFVPGLLDKLCVDGKLYKMPADFNVWSVAVPKELADSYSEWNFDVLMDINENLPEGYVIFSGNREDFIRYFCYYCSLRFVDRKEGSCSFDEPDFARWLEFIKDMEFPDENKAGLLDFTLIHTGLPRFCRERYGDYVYRGFPDSEGGMSFLTGSMGGYSIMADSENKDAAWEYIKVMLSYEIQDALSVFGLQVMEKNLQERFDRASEYTEFTEEDREKFEELLSTAEGMAFGGTLEKIITEEANKYFAGQKSLEDAVRLIQSRAGIYLAEKN